jgi:hypothetical protein
MSAIAAGVFTQSARLALGQKVLLKDSHGNYQVPAESLSDPLLRYTRTTFESYLKSDFLVTVGPYKTVRLTLVKVEDLNVGVRKSKMKMEGECFALLFKASDKLSTLQQTYVLQHEALGKFSLFLVDASSTEKEVYFQAIINHSKPS